MPFRLGSIRDKGGNGFFVNGRNVRNTIDILPPEDIFATFCLHQLGGGSEQKGVGLVQRQRIEGNSSKTNVFIFREPNKRL
jgi:hypothetical protein